MSIALTSKDAPVSAPAPDRDPSSPVVSSLAPSHAEFAFLDGVRGLMALWVLLGHTLPSATARLPLLRFPWLAVEVFMVMSGFLMALHYRAREDQEPWGSPRTWMIFYTRRFFRIVPLYYLLLTLALVFQPMLFDLRDRMGPAPATETPPTHVDPTNSARTPLNILAHYTFTFGLFPALASNNALPDWSIGLEMQFYLCLPFLMLLFRRVRHFWATAALVGVGAVAVRLFGVYTTPGPLGLFPQPTFLPLKLVLFAIGILMAEAYSLRPKQPAAGAMAAGLAFAIAGLAHTRFMALVVGFWLLLLFYPLRSDPFLIGRPLRLAKWILSSRICRFMGDTSYGVYLVHMLVVLPVAGTLCGRAAFARLAPLTRFAVLLAIVVPLVYALAYLLHRAIEIPGIAMGKRVARRWRAPGPRDRAVPELTGQPS